MITDLYADRLPTAVEADVCIIGGGAAGLILGREIAARDYRVALLESGGRVHETDIHELNTTTCSGLPHRGILEGRFRALGGTTTKWAGQMVPLWPFDFERRCWIEWSGWPLRYAELAPYYQRALDCVGLGASFATDSEVWLRMGLEQPHLGNDVEPYLSRWCPEPNFARLYAGDIERSQRLLSILHATVVGFSATPGRVEYAMARSLRGHSVEVRAQDFVICAGAIETPRLLLQPLADGSPAAWADMPALGRFFQDHLFGLIADVIPVKRRKLHQIFDNIHLNGTKYRPYFSLSAAKRRQLGLLGAGCSMLFQSRRAEPLERMRAACDSIWRGRLTRPALADAAAGVLKGGPTMARLIWRTLIEGRAYSPDDLGARLAVQLEQAPRPDSRISLVDEVDSLGMRRAQLDWRLGELEVETIAAFAQIAKTAFEQAGLAQIRIDSDVAARSPDVLRRLTDFFHQTGTARMGTSRASGVVDSQLRVFGSDNLYLCGSAVFPTSGISNPTHTIIALALRLADHLHARARAS
jgi:choline dehydrogenase-like flavoprotein